MDFSVFFWNLFYECLFITFQFKVDKPADFETAIIGAGFGKCNIFLLVLTLPAAWTVQFESTLASFVNPAAECDLNLTLEDKGVITSMVFAGMILSGPLWGFLLDTLGRRKMLFIGSSIQFLVCLLSSLAQSKVYMVILKLIGGIMVGGIYVGYITYLQEFHSSRFRGRIQMIVGLIYNAPTLLLPVLASFIIPLKFHAVLCNSIELRSWNLLILVCSLGSLASAVSFYFLPESPKYLMTAGENEKALQIFQKVFSINTGNDAKSYPVKKLAAEQQPENQNEEAKTNQSFVNYLKNGWNQVSPLFREEYGPKFFLVCIIQPLSLMSVNTFRLWLPQIFQTMHDYEVENNRTAPDLCTIIGMFQYRSSNKTQPACNVKLENDLTPYVDSMITAVATMCGYIVAGIFINVFRRKLLSVLVGVAASLSVMSLYFSQNSATTLSLASLNVTFANIYFDMVLTIIVVMFPTTLRGTAVSLNMLIGRLMIVVGNLVFPRLLQARCEAPFLTLGIATLIATLLTFFLPNTESIKLQ